MGILDALGLNASDNNPNFTPNNAPTPEQLKALQALGAEQANSNIEYNKKGPLPWTLALANSLNQLGGLGRMTIANQQTRNAAQIAGGAQKEMAQPAIDQTNQSLGVNPSDTNANFDMDNYIKRQAQIESGGNNSQITGSNYGRQQFSKNQWAKYGINSQNWQDPAVQDNAAKQEAIENIARFTQKYNRAPSAGELYMMHQQGADGAFAHFDNPNGSAVSNISKFYPNGGIATKAITGNGGTADMTSGQFVNMWSNKFGKGNNWQQNTQVASAQPQIANDAGPQLTIPPGTSVEPYGSPGGGPVGGPATPQAAAPQPAPQATPAPANAAPQAPQQVAQAAPGTQPTVPLPNNYSVQRSQAPVGANIGPEYWNNAAIPIEDKIKTRDAIIANTKREDMKYGNENVGINPLNQVSRQPGPPQTLHEGELPITVQPPSNVGAPGNVNTSTFNTPESNSPGFNAATAGQQGLTNAGEAMANVNKMFATAHQAGVGVTKDIETQRDVALHDYQAGTAAATARPNLNIVKQITEDPEFEKQLIHGPLGPLAQQINTTLSNAGITLTGDKRSLAVGDVANYVQTGLGGDFVREITNRGTQFDFMTGIQRSPGLLQSADGAKMLVDLMLQKNDLDQKLGNIARQHVADPTGYAEARTKLLNETHFDLNFRGKTMEAWAKDQLDGKPVPKDVQTFLKNSQKAQDNTNTTPIPGKPYQGSRAGKSYTVEPQ